VIKPAITEIQAQQIRVRGFVERPFVTTRTARLTSSTGSPTKAGAPFLDGTDRDTCDPGDIAVDQALVA